jgi:hypothetical protein
MKRIDKMLKDRLFGMLPKAIMPAVKREKRQRNSVADAYRKFMKLGGDMTTRELSRRTARLTADVLARPRELFGESLPELLLVSAVLVAVVSAVLTLNGAG